MIKIYGIKNCDIVKKAIKFFKNHNIEYQLQDFKTDAVSSDKISLWLKDSDIKTLFNARSTTYRTLKLKEKNLTEIQKEEWLSKENLLIKRPVIEFNEKIIVGFNEESYKGVFL
ncbi:MAG: Spx/MgsR family RNA polymerase-binding regulatory protein [Campylobacterota bacterium]|nr:Spx/MgsR family RNA polymerase-binding regulatory protein [Campylobacterota bacterium]